MSVPTRQQWAKQRDTAGGSAGLVKAVSIGDLLDAYSKAAGNKHGLGLMLATTKQVTDLSKGLKIYRKAVPANKPKLAKLVDDLIKYIDGMVKDGAQMANPAFNTVDQLKDTITASAAVAAGGDRAAYAELWKGRVRGTGTGLAALAKLDPSLEPLRKAWLPLTDGKWDFKGEKVAGTETDPAVVVRRTKAAAAHINKQALALMAELKRRNVTS